MPLVTFVFGDVVVIHESDGGVCFADNGDGVFFDRDFRCFHDGEVGIRSGACGREEKQNEQE